MCTCSREEACCEVEQRQGGQEHRGDRRVVVGLADRHASNVPNVITNPCASAAPSSASRTGAPTGRGARSIRPGVGSSKPSAIAMGMSITMLSQRIWRIQRDATRDGEDAGPDEDQMKRRASTSGTAGTSTGCRRGPARIRRHPRSWKLSSVRIITAASFQTSVPVNPSRDADVADERGGVVHAVPVIATMFSIRWSIRTSRTLSSGATGRADVGQFSEQARRRSSPRTRRP